MINTCRLLCILLPLFVLLFSTHSCAPEGAETAVTSMIPEHYTRHCASCHGADMRGEIAQSLLDGSWQFGSRRNDIFRSVKFGHPHHGMPSWAAVLADEEIDTLVGFLLKEEARLGVMRPPLPTKLETQDYMINVEVVTEGLTSPWALQFLNQDRALITEQGGKLRIWENGQVLPDTVAGIPRVRTGGQGGLLDVAIDPDYSTNGWVYLSFSHALPKREGDDNIPGMTKVVRGKIVNNTWTEEQVLFEAPHETYTGGNGHFGSRIVFDPEGYLYFSIGERGMGDHAQDLTRPNGKVHRIYPDGRIPQTNPFYGQVGVIASIYSYGHRNPQGLAVHPETGQVWATEHGPLGGDELNLIRPGLNYGWPVISYGINYNGEIITEFFRKEGMEQPIYYWKPSIAVCGLDYYHGDLFPKWNNRLLVGALKFEEVQLLDIEKDRVMYRQTLLKNAGRVRDITTGPDGAIYVVLNRPDVVLRLSPEPAI